MVWLSTGSSCKKNSAIFCTLHIEDSKGYDVHSIFSIVSNTTVGESKLGAAKHRNVNLRCSAKSGNINPAKRRHV